jgi:hypothetical protein
MKLKKFKSFASLRSLNYNPILQTTVIDGAGFGQPGTTIQAAFGQNGTTGVS